MVATNLMRVCARAIASVVLRFALVKQSYQELAIAKSICCKNTQRSGATSSCKVCNTANKEANWACTIRAV